MVLWCMYRFSLLKDIDRLSKKLRGLTVVKTKSGLYALPQSAVTGEVARFVACFDLRSPSYLNR